MSQFPRVSVLIPTYNSAPFLDEAIQSVLDQTFADFELIINDNNSTDDTEEIAKKYLSDPRVSFYKNPANIGMAGNWNKLLAHAKGEYIKFLMSDDKFHPQLLEKFVPVMDQYPNVSLITSFRREFGMEHYTNEPPFTHLQPGKKIICETLKDRNWIGEPSSVMFRKSNLWVGGYNPDYTFLLDWDMSLRQLSVGDCYIMPEFLSYFRVHEKQVSKIMLKTFMNYFEVYQFYKSIKETNPYKIDFSELNIDLLLKKKAAICANAVVKLIPKLYKKENRAVFKKAINIVYSEKVIFNSFKEVLKSFNRKVQLAFPK